MGGCRFKEVGPKAVYDDVAYDDIERDSQECAPASVLQQS